MQRATTPAPPFTGKLNRVEAVPYHWPIILPTGWIQFKSGDTEAVYRSTSGLLVLCSSSRESDGRHWLHVSFSRKDRIPDYEDLKEVKSIFIGDDRTAYQIFPSINKHINVHPHCLHLWALADGSALTPDFTRGNGVI